MTRRRGGSGGALVVAAAVLCSVGFAQRAEAQIVNVQSLIGEIKEGVSGGVDASADWRTGNVALLILSGAGTLRYKHDKDLVFAIVKGDYGKLIGDGVPDTKFMKKTFEHVRYRRAFHPRVTGEAFVQNEADEFRRLLLRALVGVGPRFTIVAEPSVFVAAGVAYMFEYEKIREDMELDAGATQSNHRLSSYAVVSIGPNDKIKVGDTVYFQPRVDDPGDFRLLNELSLLSKISTHVAIKTAFVLAYDTSPPDKIKKLDTTLQTGISLSF